MMAIEGCQSSEKFHFVELLLKSADDILFWPALNDSASRLRTFCIPPKRTMVIMRKEVKESPVLMIQIALENEIRASVVT